MRLTWNQKVVLAAFSVAAIGTPVMALLPDGRCAKNALCRTFSNIGGHAYSYPIILPYSKADDASSRNSTVMLYEDGRPLGPAHSDFQDIKDNGSGRFIYWQNSTRLQIVMSASDNTNPNTNGRTYTFVDPAASDLEAKMMRR